MRNNVKSLIVSPHPDDETLGCGGTILKHKALGDETYWLIMTNIDENHGWDVKKVRERQSTIKKVSSMYGFQSTYKLDFATTKLDTISINDLIIGISKVINEVIPTIIYVPNRSDIHTDHQVTFKAVVSCTKSFRYPFIKKILMYECLSETEFSLALPENVFIPNVFVDITDFFKEKIEIMKVYDTEIMKAPYPRNLDVIESLAKYRGSRIGKKYAEAFMLLEEII